MSSNIEIGSITGTSRPQDPVDFRILVSSAKTGREVRFKGAIGQNGVLDLVETTTPYEKEFCAHNVIAMFESLDPLVPVKVELFGDIGQTWSNDRPICSFTGPHGGITQDIAGLKSLGAGGIYG